MPHVAAMRMPVDVAAVTDDALSCVDGDGLSGGHPVLRYADNALHAANDPADNPARDTAQHAANRTSDLVSGRRSVLNTANDALSLGGCGHCNGGHREHSGDKRASHLVVLFLSDCRPRRKRRRGRGVSRIRRTNGLRRLTRVFRAID
jgi:hypothetical protein